MLLTPLRRQLLGSLASKPLARNLSTSSLLRAPIVKSAFKPQPAITKPSPFATKRFFTTDPAITARPSRETAVRKLLYGGALFGGTLLAANILFNSEGRVGGIPDFERQYLKETFTYTGVGVGMIGLAAKGLHNVGWSYRLMTASPWAVLGVGLVASIGTMMATLYTPPEK